MRRVPKLAIESRVTTLGAIVMIIGAFGISVIKSELPLEPLLSSYAGLGVYGLHGLREFPAGVSLGQGSAKIRRIRQ